MIRHFFAAGMILAALTSGMHAEPLEIAPGTWLLRGRFVPGTQPDGNSVLFSAPDGLVVVDTGRHEAHTRSILEFATEKRFSIAAVVNTHWHLDHVGGNILVRRAFPEARVYATGAIDGALSGFLARYRESLAGAIGNDETPAEQREQFRREAALIDAGKVLSPDVVVRRSESKRLAGKKLDLFVTDHAATEADIWVYDRKSRVLVAGDLITLPVPFLDTGCPEGMRAQLDSIAEKNFRVVIPGHGPAMSRSEFESYRSAFSSLLDCAASEKTKEQCTEDWIASMGNLLPSAEHDFTRSLMGYYFDAHLRGDPAQTARLCGN